MKILQINTWYGEGSTGKLVEILHKGYLSCGFESYVIYGRGKKRNEQNVIKGSYTLECKLNSVFSRLSGVMYGGSFFSTSHILRLINKIKPDVIHVHCVNSFILNNYRFFKYLGENGYKVLFTIHAEYPYTGSCSHSLGCNQWINGCKKCPRLKFASRSLLFDNTSLAWKKMKKAVSYIKPGNMVVAAVSEWLSENASRSSILKDYKHVVIHNGIDKDVFRCYPQAKNKYSSLRKDNVYYCLYVTPTFLPKEGNVKGGDYFIKLVDSFKDNDKVKFIVAGGNKYNFDFSKYNNVIYLGNITNQNDLVQLYSFADVTLMLSRGETFSLVTAESLCCGTPVLGFKSGGPESISKGEEALFYEQGDIESVSAAIKNRTLKKTKGTTSFGSDEMVKQYIDIVNGLVEDNSK